MNLTPEQSAILNAVFARGRDLIISTAIDSPNDLVWLELVKKGVLEFFEPCDPAMIHLAEVAQLRFYRLTQDHRTTGTA